MNQEKFQQQKSQRRHARIRAKISGTAERPRLSVFRSNRGMFLQLIDDENGKTLVSASMKEVKTKGKKTEVSLELGKILAEKALTKKISAVVFDKSSYRYHGRVKAVAEGARTAGLKF